jgi:hypothetical protein
MPEHPEATSPTGTPVVSPTSVPLYLVVGVALAAGFTAAGQILPEAYALARTLCTVLGVAIGAGLGVASPGLRRAGTTLALFLAVGLLSGCGAHLHQDYRPGPLPCAGAKGATMAWEELDTYMRQTLAQQSEYACSAGPVPLLFVPAQP